MKYWYSNVFQLFGKDTGVSLIPTVGLGGGLCFAVALIAIYYGLVYLRKGRGHRALYVLLALFPSVIGTYCGFINLVRGLLTISWLMSEEAEGFMGGPISTLAESFAERLYIGFFGSGLTILLMLLGIPLLLRKHEKVSDKEP